MKPRGFFGEATVDACGDIGNEEFLRLQVESQVTMP